MPAIRDSFSLGLTGTAASITLSMPTHEAGDLLLAIANYDAGAPTWPAISGWTQLGLLANGTAHSCVIYWKIAASNAEADIVIAHGATADTMSGVTISIRDVDQTNPFGSPQIYNAATQAASTRFAMQQVTPNRDNSLVMYVYSHTGVTSSPQICENASQIVNFADSGGESLGVGWVFQKTSGVASPNDIYANSTGATGVGCKFVFQVCPPVGGATVIPTYTVSDASIYLNPNTSTTAWDSTTSMAATADTNWGTTNLGGTGITANDATVAAAADIGIWSYNSMMGLTNAATAGQISGAEVVMNAGRYNVGNRNILCHFRSTTPANNQRLSTLGSGRGVWFGMKSGATAAANFKIWQVHGSDVPMTAGYIQPIVINAANTDTKGSNGTLDNADIRRYGFWTGGVGALTQQSSFGSLWAMDTIVLAGGNAAYPMTVPDIVKTAGLLHNRLSSTLQGSNQMLCLQAIQYGNGGTNPLYLKVNGGAVEFPSQKNLAKQAVNYNGINDSIGWTFYPGASDTVDLEGTSFASASKYHWRVHASASASATYKFNGVVINGAGDVQLRAVTTFSGMSFANCPTIYTNGATLSGNTFTNSKVFVSSPANAALISNSDFIKTTGTSHAIEISGSVSDITINGLSFTGYEEYVEGGTSTGNEAIFVNILGGNITISVAGGGTTPSYKTAGANVTISSGATITVNNLVTGSRVKVTRDDNSGVLFNGPESSGQISFTTSYAGAFTVDVRKASSAPYYKPWVGGGISAIGSTTTVKALQESD